MELLTLCSSSPQSTQLDPEELFTKLDRIGKGSFGEVGVIYYFLSSSLLHSLPLSPSFLFFLTSLFLFFLSWWSSFVFLHPCFFTSLPPVPSCRSLKESIIALRASSPSKRSIWRRQRMKSRTSSRRSRCSVSATVRTSPSTMAPTWR